jgi:hypothetical protein
MDGKSIYKGGYVEGAYLARGERERREKVRQNSLQGAVCD